MDLLVMAIGLVLGATCCAVWLYARRASAAVETANRHAEATLRAAEACHETVRKMADKYAVHNNEIATLYDKLNLRRQ